MSTGRARKLCALVVGGSLGLSAVGGPAGARDLRALAPAIERNLQQNVVAFWYPRVIDREHGGYLIDFDATGHFKGQAPKMNVTQARMLWLSARLMRSGRADDVVRDAARV